MWNAAMVARVAIRDTTGNERAVYGTSLRSFFLYPPSFLYGVYIEVPMLGAVNNEDGMKSRSYQACYV
jgi:hypothetical protein